MRYVSITVNTLGLPCPGLLLACSGLPTSRFGKASLSFGEVRRRIAAAAPRQKLRRADAVARAQAGKPPERKAMHIKRGLTSEDAQKSPRQLRLEMHEARAAWPKCSGLRQPMHPPVQRPRPLARGRPLGREESPRHVEVQARLRQRSDACPTSPIPLRVTIQARLGIEGEADPDTDDGDDAFSIMERLDTHLQASLENLRSPSPWVRQSVVLSLSAVHGTSLLAVINAVLRMTPKGPAIGSTPGAGPSGAEGASAHESAAARAASHLPDLTRLMSSLSHHVALPDVLLSCPEMLPHLLEFMQQVNAALLGPVRQLLASGQPTRGLLSSLDPEEELPWALDYLTMVAGVADALCRLRDRREQPPLSTHRPLPATLCPPPSALCPLPATLCPLPSATGASTKSSPACCPQWTRPPGRCCSGTTSTTSSNYGLVTGQAGRRFAMRKRSSATYCSKVRRAKAPAVHGTVGYTARCVGVPPRAPRHPADFQAESPYSAMHHVHVCPCSM